MRRKLRSVKRQTFLYDFSLYRTSIPMPDDPTQSLSVIDLHPEDVEQTIVFQHGYGGVGESFEFQITHFASNYRVVVPDMRGHGQSDAPFTDYTMDELVRDMHQVVEKLKLPEQFILVGHSFGGSLCIEYAHAHPERVDKLILIATAGEFEFPKIIELIRRIPVSAIRPFWKYRPRFDAEPHTMKRLLFNTLYSWQGWSIMRNLQMETLVITGERDNLFTRRIFDDVGKIIPKAEVVDVGASKHKVQLERHEAVNRAIARFIGEKRVSWRDRGESQPSRPWLKHYSEQTPPSIPIPKSPLYQYLESAADWRPNQTALIFYGQTLTYSALNGKVNQFANALLEMGIKQGDRVMVVLPNTPQMVIAYYAILKIGAVGVLPNPDADAPRLVNQAKVTDSKVLITLDAYAKLAQAIKQSTLIEHVVFASIHAIMGEKPYKQLLRDVASNDDVQLARQVGVFMNDILPRQPIDNLDMDVDPNSLANINFTSGTTDAPKGVCLTHRNLVANALQTRHWVPDLKYGEEVMLSVVPFLHSYGMTTCMNVPITIAATIVMLSVFDLQQVLEQIKVHKPTIFPAVPSMYTAINQAPNVREYGLSSIKACISGAAPLPVEVQEAFEKLTRGRLVEGYGLTEASPVTHANPLYGLRKIGSIGVPLPNTDAKLVDLVTGEELGVGDIGELAVRGPQVMQGYWNDDSNDPETESVLRDGWLYTGDVATMDEDGYFTIISRKRDTIMTGNYSVYPRDVEEVLYENNKVLEAAVVGIGSEDGEQRVKAYVVPRPNTSLSVEELIKLCRSRLEEYAIPYEIEFRDALPKSFVGKVLRRLLNEDKTGD